MAGSAKDAASYRYYSLEAGSRAGNLSMLERMLGDLVGAMEHAEQAVKWADSSTVTQSRSHSRTTLADALHSAGRQAEAEAQFREAEQLQAQYEPAYPLLYSLWGFRYCDLLLAAPECVAWQTTLQLGTQNPELETAIAAVSERGAKMFAWRHTRDSLSDIALDHLTLGRAALYAAILENSNFRLLTSDLSHIDAAVAGLRRASTQDHLPLGLLTRAWLRFLDGARTGPESAQADLDEAWEIAERGPMKLHMADIHLHRTRLFFREKKYPWNKNPDGSARGPKDDLDAAEKLINACGYHRRDEELADAKQALQIG